MMVNLALQSPQTNIVTYITKAGICSTIPTYLGTARPAAVWYLILWISILYDGLFEVLEEVSESNDFGDDSELKSWNEYVQVT